MQSARARDQLPPTMDHKGTVEISSEYHAVGGMVESAAGSHLFFQRHLCIQGEEDLFLDSVQPGTQLYAWPPVFTCQLQTTQERLTIKLFYNSYSELWDDELQYLQCFALGSQLRNHSYGGSKP